MSKPKMLPMLDVSKGQFAGASTTAIQPGALKSGLCKSTLGSSSLKESRASPKFNGYTPRVCCMRAAWRKIPRHRFAVGPPFSPPKFGGCFIMRTSCACISMGTVYRTD